MITMLPCLLVRLGCVRTSQFRFDNNDFLTRMKRQIGLRQNLNVKIIKYVGVCLVGNEGI